MFQESYKKLCSLIWFFSFSSSALVINSLKAICFKGRFPECMRNVFYVRQLDISVIIFWFSFNAMYLGENNGNLRETKKCFLCQHVSQPFLKMRKFFLDMRKDFLIMSNFYLVEILSEPNSLTIVTSKKILKMSNYVLILSIFVFIMRIRNLQCYLQFIWENSCL